MPRPFALGVLALALLACSGAPEESIAPLAIEVGQIDEPPADASAAVIEPAALRVFTYDGSGELVHPDAQVFYKSWKGKRYWYAATPYPFGNSALENPSGYVGNGRDDWHLAPGASNPLALPDRNAYLSDPDIAYDPSRDELRLYYRQTTLTADQIFLKTSRDGVTWSAPRMQLEEARFNAISPAVVREPDGSWRMWTVGARTGGCYAISSKLELRERRSSDGLSWGTPTPVTLVIPRQVPWHWDVQYVTPLHEYWALIAAYPEGTDCSHTAVYFARSADGTTWDASPSPLLGPGMLEDLNDLVYRSTFRYFASDDLVTVWFSGAHREGTDFHYSIATARYPREELMRRVSAPPSPRSMGRHAVVRPTYADSVARAAFAEAFP